MIEKSEEEEELEEFLFGKNIISDRSTHADNEIEVGLHRFVDYNTSPIHLHYFLLNTDHD